MPGHGGHGSMPHGPAAGARNVPGAGPGASNAEPACGSPRINAAGVDERHTDPEPPVGGLVTTARKVVVGRPARFLGTAYINACEGASFPAALSVNVLNCCNEVRRDHRAERNTACSSRLDRVEAAEDRDTVDRLEGRGLSGHGWQRRA